MQVWHTHHAFFSFMGLSPNACHCSLRGSLSCLKVSQLVSCLCKKSQHFSGKFCEFIFVNINFAVTTVFDFLALLTSILAEKSGCSPLEIHQEHLHYFGDYCDYFCQNCQFQQAKARQKAGRPLLMRAFAAGTVNFDKNNHNNYQNNNTTPQNDFFRLFGTFGVNSRRKKRLQPLENLKKMSKNKVFQTSLGSNIYPNLIF